MHWGGNRRFLCPPSKNLDFALGVICTSYLAIDNELGDGENRNRSAMPQGIFLPSISVVRSTGDSDSRVYDIDFSIEQSIRA